MNAEILAPFLQLGVAGASLYVLLRVMSTELPRALAPITEALRENSEVQREAVAVQRLVAERLSRVEAKQDAREDRKSNVYLVPPNGR